MQIEGRYISELTTPNNGLARIATMVSADEPNETIIMADPERVMDKLRLARRVIWEEDQKPSAVSFDANGQPRVNDPVEAYRVDTFIKASIDYPVRSPVIYVNPGPLRGSMNFIADEHTKEVIFGLAHAGCMAVPVVVKHRDIDLKKLEADIGAPGHVFNGIPDETLAMPLEQIAGSVDRSAALLHSYKQEYRDYLLGTFTLSALHGDTPDEARGIRERLRKNIKGHDGFDKCQEQIDVLVCAGVPGMNLKTETGEIASTIFGAMPLLNLLSPLVEDMRMEIETPKDSPMGLVARLSAMAERYDAREKLEREGKVSHDSLKDLDALLTPLAIKVLNNGECHAIIKKSTPLKEWMDRYESRWNKYQDAYPHSIPRNIRSAETRVVTANIPHSSL